MHKDNLRPCSEREYSLYNDLPLAAKQALGFPFSKDEILEAIHQGRVPEFWREEPTSPARPVTRSVAKSLPEPVLALAPFDSSDSDSEDDAPTPVKRVTFNI